MRLTFPAPLYADTGKDCIFEGRKTMRYGIIFSDNRAWDPEKWKADGTGKGIRTFFSTSFRVNRSPSCMDQGTTGPTVMPI